MATEPVHEIRFGDVRASIWANAGKAAVSHHVTFQRLYQEDGKTKTANAFRMFDLPVLAYTAGQAHKWLMALEADQARVRRKPDKKKTKVKPVESAAIAGAICPEEENGHG